MKCIANWQGKTSKIRYSLDFTALAGQHKTTTTIILPPQILKNRS